MAYSKKNVASVFEQFEAIRKENEINCNDRLVEVYGK